VKGVKLFKENNRRLRFLSQEEVSNLLNACTNHLKSIVMTALNTGMRSGEILFLRWECVDLDSGIITVVNSKNSESRNIPINTILTEELSRLKLDAKNEYVFVRENGNPPETIQKAWLKALSKAGIKDFRFHDLRHTFASYLVMAGADIVTVKELLGHKTMAMTMRYAHLNQEHKKKVVEFLDRQYLDTRPNLPTKQVCVSH
jgi:integrase